MVCPIRQTSSFRGLDRTKKEIRVLILKPGTIIDVVKCNIQYISLKTGPEQDYEALSYVWGSRTNKSTIILDDTQVEIPATAEEALRNLRLSETIRILWIDAICIDQDNLAERNHQVAMMGEVYRRTVQTVIWLGKPDRFTARAFAALEEIYKDIQRCTSEDCSQLRDVLYGKANIFQYDTCRFPKDIDFESIRALYTRPWFRRIWVVQEAVLAPQAVVQCGELTTSLKKLLRDAVWMQHKQHHLPFDVEQESGILNASYMWAFGDRTEGWFAKGRGPQATLADLLRYFHTFDATVSLDKVYGLLGMSQWGSDMNKIPRLLLPDYSKTERDCFRDATKSCILESGDLWVLRYVDHISVPEGSIAPPSWCPRLFYKPETEEANPLRSTFRANHGLPASRDVIVDVVVDGIQEPDMLIAEGVVLDKVAGVGPTLAFNKMRPEDPLPLVELINHLLFGRSLDGLTPNEALKKFAIRNLVLILLGGSTFDPEPYSTDNDTPSLSIFDTFTELLERTDHQLEAKDHAERFEFIRNLIETGLAYGRIFWAIQYACANRRLITTEKGYVGLAPRATAIGDDLCILGQCRLPVLLRPGISTFKVVGPIYIDGIMQGLSEDSLAGADIQAFHLL